MILPMMVVKHIYLGGSPSLRNLKMVKFTKTECNIFHCSLYFCVFFYISSVAMGGLDEHMLALIDDAKHWGGGRLEVRLETPNP